MRVGELRRQIEQAISDCNLSDNDEVVLDMDDGIFGIAQIMCESERIIISAGDAEDEYEEEGRDPLA